MKKTGRKSEPDSLRQKSGEFLKKKAPEPAAQDFKAEAELKESEERYRWLFENSGEAILLTNPDGSIYSANPAACRMYGRTEDELCKIGRNGILDLNDPRLVSAINERNKTGKFKGELNQVRKDGTVFPTEITSTVFRDSSGNERTSMIVRDISESRIVEKEMHLQSEIMNNLAEGFNLVRLDNEIIVFTNSKFDEMFGYEHGELIGKNISVINAPGTKSPDETKQEIVDTVNRSGEWHGEILNIKKNGEHFWCYVNISMFDHADYGKVYLSVHSDINKRKQSEEDLKQSLDWQKAIFEGSRDAIFISDQDSRFVAANKAGTDLTGYPLEMLLKMRIPDIHDINDLNAYRMYHRRIFGGEEILSEAKILRRDGQKIDTEFNNRRILIAGKHYMHTTARDITEKKRTVEALRLEKENFRHSLDESPLGIRIATADGDTIYANQAILNIYGYDSLEELQRTPLKNRYTPESYIESQIRKQQRNHGDISTTNYEISIVRKNGEIRHLQVFRKEVLWDGIRQFQVIYNDITDRKCVEEALHESEERYRRLVEGSPDAIAVHSKGRFVFVNSAGAKLIGADSPRELIGKPILDVVHPDSRSQVIERLRHIAEGKEAPLFEEKFLKFDGSVIDVEVVGIPLSYQGQSASQVVVRDITERKKATASLVESEARFRSIFENLFVGISIAPPEGGLILVNPAYARMYGYENPEILLSEVRDTTKLFSNPEERKEVLRELQSKGFMEAKEFELIRRDGSRFFALVSAREIRDTDGKLLYNQATHIDLTERRKMESELRNSKELLEKLNQHLIEVREDERADISREIHDELGQSLTALKLDLNRLYKYVNANHEAVTQLDSMIELISDTIKDVQRIASDLRPGILDELGLVSAIEWYCGEFENRTRIKCTLELDNSDYSNPQINLTFFRALQETLTNVIRHARASSVKVILQQTNQGTTLTIQDNGIGISREEIDSNKSLGLISMHERVKQFNGKIEISSKKGDGTKLTVFIPS